MPREPYICMLWPVPTAATEAMNTENAAPLANAPLTMTLSGAVTGNLSPVSDAVHSLTWVLTAEAMLRAGPSMATRPSMAWPNVMLRVFAWASASRIQMRPEGRASAPLVNWVRLTLSTSPIEPPSMSLRISRYWAEWRDCRPTHVRTPAAFASSVISSAWATVVPSGHSV